MGQSDLIPIDGTLLEAARGGLDASSNHDPERVDATALLTMAKVCPGYMKGVSPTPSNGPHSDRLYDVPYGTVLKCFDQAVGK